VPRPLTHDLLASFIRDHGFKVDHVEFYGADGKGFLARMQYRKGAKKFKREIRPSDGIALSLRLAFPILADPALLEMAPSLAITADQALEGESKFYFIESPEYARQRA
jgi:uncharacterized protein